MKVSVCRSKYHCSHCLIRPAVHITLFHEKIIYLLLSWMLVFIILLWILKSRTPGLRKEQSDIYSQWFFMINNGGNDNQIGGCTTFATIRKLHKFLCIITLVGLTSRTRKNYIFVIANHLITDEHKWILTSLAYVEPGRIFGYSSW